MMTQRTLQHFLAWSAFQFPADVRRDVILRPEGQSTYTIGPVKLGHEGVAYFQYIGEMLNQRLEEQFTGIDGRSLHYGAEVGELGVQVNRIVTLS